MGLSEIVSEGVFSPNETIKKEAMEKFAP